MNLINKKLKENIKKYKQAVIDANQQYNDGLIDLKEYNQQFKLAWLRYKKKSGCNK